MAESATPPLTIESPGFAKRDILFVKRIIEAMETLQKDTTGDEIAMWLLQRGYSTGREASENFLM